MPQKTNEDKELLAKLEKTPDANLTQSVEETEGVTGATVELIYSQRKMHCYSITESELQQIGLANIAITSLGSIGSALLAFSLDIYKDTLLAEEIPAATRELISYIQPVLLSLGVAFWVIAIIAVFWRKKMIKLIKEESNAPRK